MNPDAIYLRTLTCWQLAYIHAGKMLHFLTSALLLSMASAGLGFGWLCCRFDRFLSAKGSGGWMISAKRLARSDMQDRRPAAVATEVQPLALERRQPRTIDSLIRGKGTRF